MPRKGGGGRALQKDAPWRSSSVNLVTKIRHSPIFRLPQTPYSNHALSVVKHPRPIGYGMATEAIDEAAGPYCIVPGQTVPIKLLGLKVWPVEMDLHFLKPVGRELFCDRRNNSF